MSTQNTLYKLEYPRYCNTRLKRSTLEQIKKRGISGESIDTIVSRILTQLQEFEKRGYEISGDNRST